MKKITALYSKAKNYTLYSESVGKKTVFELSHALKEKNAVLYVVGDRLFRLPLSGGNRATLEGDVYFNSAFLVIDGAIVAESGLKGEKHERERIKSMILNRESEVKGRAEVKPRAENKTEEFQSPAIQEIIKRARELFSMLEQENVKAYDKEESFNPFPDAFPNASFEKRICEKSGKAFLYGQYKNENGKFSIWAHRGEESFIPSRMRKNGFKKFLRASDGSGYWVKIMPKNG